MQALPVKYFVDQAGYYLGAFSGFQRVPEDPGTIVQPMPKDPNAVEVPGPPPNGKDRWDGSAWVPHTPDPIDVDAVLATRDPLLQALVELVPGGAEAVRAKIEAMPPRTIRS